ncbi:hypothetical protein ACL9RI_13770 [Janthinobacterium sp. Mn2066]|uniref:hypothetical protein n=1 Tax=Janthinobacterium sp. Mn2066 TaxID=3395264 RepID=UPI003BBA08D6
MFSQLGKPCRAPHSNGYRHASHAQGNCGAGATQDRADAGRQLARRKQPDDVIAGTDFYSMLRSRSPIAAGRCADQRHKWRIPMQRMDTVNQRRAARAAKHAAGV